MARHYDITEWADFSRGVGDPRDRAAMQEHLDDGCEPCRAMAHALGRVAAVAARDIRLTPPAGALRSVTAILSVYRPDAVSRWRDLLPRRVFDSALAPAMASRSTQPDVRHLLFESDAYTVEVSVACSAGSVDALLRGQILETHGGPRSHAPVFLVGDGEVIGRAVSERHGTFEMSGPLDQPCELWVFPDDNNRIRLSLGDDG